jgi:hypothetical protein
MELYASAVLDYENKRRSARQEFSLGFQSWQEQCSGSRGFGGQKVSVGYLMTHHALWEEEDPFRLKMLPEFVGLCFSYLFDEVSAFARLLRCVGVSQSQAIRESKDHMNFLLEDAYEHVWLWGLSKHPYFSPWLGNPVKSELTTALWSTVKELALKQQTHICAALWSGGANSKEFESYELIDATVGRIIAKEIKKSQRKRLTPNHNEQVIIKAINEGRRSISFCYALDQGGVEPRNGWLDTSNPYPWPGSYVDAYKTNQVANKNFWKKKIQDYKNDVQTKFQNLIHRKKRIKNSPTRRGE